MQSSTVGGVDLEPATRTGWGEKESKAKPKYHKSELSQTGLSNQLSIKEI